MLFRSNFPDLTYLFNRALTVSSLSSPHNKATSFVEKIVLEDLNKTSKYSPFLGLLSIFILQNTLKVSYSSYISIGGHGMQPIGLIENDYPALEKKYLRLEPRKVLANTRQKQAFTSVRTDWLPKYSIDIPLLLNKEFMEQMAQRLALIKLMRRMEEKEIA